jgi:small conductance mechanosensitive channel
MDIDKLYNAAITWVSEYSLKVLAAILILIVGRWLARKIARLLAKVLEKNGIDVTLTGFLENITYYTLVVLVLIAAAGQLGINTTSFLTIVGAAGLAVGLALKDSLSNFSAGVMLVLFRPFKVGDVVEAAGVKGKVIGINIFNTILNTPDNQRLIVPNNNIISNVIKNVTANPTRRIDLVAGIGYADDIALAKKVLNEIVQSDDRILKDPAPQIAVSELADSSVNFVVRPWVKTADYWDAYFDLTEQIKVRFDAQGISIPYPQQDVHLIQEEKTA